MIHNITVSGLVTVIDPDLFSNENAYFCLFRILFQWQIIYDLRLVLYCLLYIPSQYSQIVHYYSEIFVYVRVLCAAISLCNNIHVFLLFNLSGIFSRHSFLFLYLFVLVIIIGALIKL